MTVEVDVWIRGTQHATTHRIELVATTADDWAEPDVHQLVSEMLRAMNREKNPGEEPPALSMRGFSWIVSPYEGGVVLHLELQSGTVSAGPFTIAEARLTDLMTRVVKPAESAERVH